MGTGKRGRGKVGGGMVGVGRGVCKDPKWPRSILGSCKRQVGGGYGGSIEPSAHNYTYDTLCAVAVGILL